MGELIRMTTSRKERIYSCNLKLNEASNWITVNDMNGRLNIAMNRMPSMTTLRSLFSSS